MPEADSPNSPQSNQSDLLSPASPTKGSRFSFRRKQASMDEASQQQQQQAPVSPLAKDSSHKRHKTTGSIQQEPKSPLADGPPEAIAEEHSPAIIEDVNYYSGDDNESAELNWRSELTEEELEKISARERHRQDVIWELLTTERDYVRDLKVVVYSFLRPILERKLINAKTAQLIFANIEDILIINQNFLEQLELRRQSSAKLIAGIGDLLLDAMEKFVVYTAYCSERQNAIAKLQKLVGGSKTLRTFLEASVLLKASS